MDLTEAKLQLKKYCADNGYEKPTYEVVSKRLVDVRKIYKVRVTVEGLVETIGEGFSRRLAEHSSAVRALEEIKEIREEQRKSREEQNKKDLNASDCDLKISNGSKDTNDSEKSESNDRNESDDPKAANEESVSDKSVDGDHNDREESRNNNNRNNSIIISADINTSARVVDDKQEVEPKANGVVVNGHNCNDQSRSSSENSADNDINGKNDNNFDEDIDNNVSNNGKINGNGEPKANSRTFRPLTKTSVQMLQDFCMSHQSPFPFYDNTFRDELFRVKCRIEFTSNDEKREFHGNGSGENIKEAKLVAADDIIKQLTELDLIN